MEIKFRKLNIYVLFLIGLFAFSCSKDDIPDLPENPDPELPELFVAGYLPHYGFNRFDLGAVSKLDRIYYFSIAPDTAGYFQMEQKHIENINRLRAKIGVSKTELFLVVGGWYESETIFPMAKDEARRIAYVDSVVQFCTLNQLDGVDLDWEAYPTAVPEDQYIALVDLFSKLLHEKSLKFTVAVAASHHELAARFKDKADQINIMSYGILDDNNQQVPMNMLNSWLQKFDDAGVPRSKRIVGVPFYGKRPYDANDNSARAILYSSIVSQASPPASSNQYGKYAYNGVELMQNKTMYLRSNGYFGIMAWELSQDTEYNSQFSLLKSIVEKAK